MNPLLKCIDSFSGRKICGLITSFIAFVQKNMIISLLIRNWNFSKEEYREFIYFFFFFSRFLTLVHSSNENTLVYSFIKFYWIGNNFCYF